MKPVPGLNSNPILTTSQAAFLKAFVKSDLPYTFRFTGGTALSAFYLKHRLSEDLDFFADQQVPFYVCEGFLRQGALERVVFIEIGGNAVIVEDVHLASCFWPSFTASQSQSPRRSAIKPAVFLNRHGQI